MVTKGEDVQTLEEVKKRYRNQWVLLEVVEEGEDLEPSKCKVLGNSKDRDDVYSMLEEVKARHIAIEYTGEIPKKGYAISLLD